MIDMSSLWHACTGSEAKHQEVKLEPQFGEASNCSKTDLVSIAITLSPAATEVSKITMLLLGRGVLIAWFVDQILVMRCIKIKLCHLQNIPSVVSAVAGLLCMKVPSSYEVSSTLDRGPLSFPGGLKAPPQGYEARHPAMFPGSRFLRPPGPPGMVPAQLHYPSPNTGESKLGVSVGGVD